MAAPTRTDIENSYALPSYRVSVWNGTSYDVISNDEIIDVSGDNDSTGKENGISFGDAVNISAQVIFADTVTLPTTWQYAKTRIEMTYNSADWKEIFYGFITGKSKSGREITVTCAGIDKKIETIKVYGPVRYRRPVATKTTVTSNDDPTDPASNAGAINEIFWRAGGRPFEQKASFPNADFYYSCDQSLIQPEWIWFSGENLLDELYMLARSSGGQIYQGSSDLIRYVQPLSLANDTTTYTITDDYYGSFEEAETTADYVGTIRAVYTPRYIQGNQVVYEDTNAKLLKVGETQTIEAITSLPVATYQYHTASGIFTGVNWNADPTYPELSGIYYTSQKVTVVMTNNTGVPMVVTSIKINGRPVVAGEKNYTSYGSQQPERNLEDNPYVQSRQHADMLCRMVHDFYAPIKPIITLNGCGFDPDRYVGETVTINSTYHTISGAYRIIGVGYSFGSLDMTLRLVDIANLPKRSQMFIAGQSYSSGDTRKVSY